jgi:hypothetical protein
VDNWPRSAGGGPDGKIEPRGAAFTSPSGFLEPVADDRPTGVILDNRIFQGAGKQHAMFRQSNKVVFHYPPAFRFVARLAVAFFGGP